MGGHGDLGYDADFDVKGFADRFLVAVRFLADREDEMRQFLAIVGTVHSMAPLLDPTAYRDMLYRKGNADDIAALVRLALPLAERFKETMQEMAV